MPHEQAHFIDNWRERKLPSGTSFLYGTATSFGPGVGEVKEHGFIATAILKGISRENFLAITVDGKVWTLGVERPR